MERLTIRNSDGSVSQPFKLKWAEALEKLAAYEDTGLEPEEIVEKVGFMSPVCVGCDGKTADGKRTEKCTYEDDVVKCLERSVHLSDLALAEEQGRLLVLPCKVGDDVFFVRENKIYRLRIQGISLSDSGQDILLHFGGYPAAYVWGSEIGRTYFLTREEAEKALEGMG